ncbi:DUF2510 domain-containing protein [Rhodococcus aetherivorans]|uniref:DUF2510 domain-containing protein n=1 Tax=Rhodococcus aetherivorans TaxID=191292 RepID=UPI00388DADAF
MGIIRKITSVGTMGIVSYRTTEERTAKYTRQTRNAARAQVAQQAMELELQRQQLEALNHANVREELRPQTTPAGWYPDPGNPAVIRWFDGGQWTGHVQPASPSRSPAVPPTQPTEG